MKKDGRKEKGERVKEGWGGGGKKGGRALKGCAPPFSPPPVPRLFSHLLAPTSRSTELARVLMKSSGSYWFPL